jgi:hypothetical protein
LCNSELRLPDRQMNPFPARTIGATFSGQGEVNLNLVQWVGRQLLHFPV